MKHESMNEAKLREILLQEQQYEYLQLPERLARRLDLENKSDYKGVKARCSFIKSYFEDCDFRDIVNIGGNCGHFSLSLLDEDLAEEAKIYDIKEDMLAMGRKIAAAMELSERAEFEQKMIDLDKLDSLPDADVLICQNVIHHAGDYFDEELVKEMGWGAYIRKFLERLRPKYGAAVLAVGFKWNKPKYWDVEKSRRRAFFRGTLKRSGWNIVSDANVFNLMTYSSDPDYRDFTGDSDRPGEPDKSDLGYLWDLITFNAIKHASKFLGPKSEKVKTSIPQLSEVAREISKSYHIYLLE
ncbi:class I SAM-dependent methyltransferase [Halarsenatibacter silvermanii]|uniref:Methyltransferase domain-containing protein n=1 Tax=Halarsenatibacter silvermanii TaxID=321763 RepID=A0A1G9PUG9_9FIRM|nr:class I SAM-dependent methyltransferase [Halarsenatibacter silvermanii]SDM01887.1 hypothetical protein SAMN04488692_11422 [Halarsenatibacter silvermanii]